MKMKFLTILFVAVAAMSSCGSKSEKTTIDVPSENSASQQSEIADYNANAMSESGVDDVIAAEEEQEVASSDVDSMLDEYESFVDKYISLLKKAAKGDMSAMSEYVEYMESAKSLAAKIDACAGAMSGSQTSRYMKITNKMTKAASEISVNSGAMPQATAEQYEQAMDAASEYMNALEGMNF